LLTDRRIPRHDRRGHWCDADLRAITRAWEDLARADGNGDWIRLDAAVREFRVTRFRLHALAGEGHLRIRYELRLVQRGDQQYPQEVAVVSRKQLARALAAPAALPKTDDHLVTVAGAVQMTGGAFSVANLAHWEEYDCPYLGRRLTVKRRRAMQTLQVPFRSRRGVVVRAVRRPRSNLKHYLREEIQEAHRTFLRNGRLAKAGKDPARRLRHGIHVDEAGRRWLTQAAAFRLHGCRQQALEHWRAKGEEWLRAQKRKRAGYGPVLEVWYYLEEDIKRLKKLQRPGDGHVVMPEETDGRVRTDASLTVNNSSAVSNHTSPPVMLSAAREDRQERLADMNPYPVYVVNADEIRGEKTPAQAGPVPDAETAIKDRLIIDLETCSVVLDGKTYRDIDRVPLLILKALQDAGPGQSRTGADLLKLPGLKGKNITRELAKLDTHKKIRAMVQGEAGDGYWLQLPPRPKCR
jgi:hypothetical protein